MKIELIAEANSYESTYLLFYWYLHKLMFAIGPNINFKMLAKNWHALIMYDRRAVLSSLFTKHEESV